MTRHEHTMVLFSRMLNRRPVWVDSLVGQRTRVSMIGLDDHGQIVVYDADGHDRRPEDYLLDDPKRGGGS